MKANKSKPAARHGDPELRTTRRARGPTARWSTQPARGEAAALVTAGVDEAGRGPLAGPVVAAAVILDPARPIADLRDSKQMTARARTALSRSIRARALAWSLGRADVTEIDALNVLQATMLAMRRAVLALDVAPVRVLVDGNRCPVLPFATQSVVGGDKAIRAISAASILAKTARDAEMREIDRRYPQYGFARHMGYPTAEHVRRLRRFGVSPVHRRSFGPVKAMLAATPAQRPVQLAFPG